MFRVLFYSLLVASVLCGNLRRDEDPERDKVPNFIIKKESYPDGYSNRMTCTVLTGVVGEKDLVARL
jgi:hypothetical protein